MARSVSTSLKSSSKSSPKGNGSANLGFETKLWLGADRLRNNMDAAEYKHVVLGLIFLKYISDAFEEMRAKLLAGECEDAGADPEDPDEYKAENVFCLRFLTKDKGARTFLSASGEKQKLRDRRKQTLFIDARKMGTLIDRVHRELADADLEKITSTYDAWRGDSSTKNKEPGTKNPTAAYADVAGFAKSPTTAEIASNGWVLTPGRYVGAEEVEDDGDPFEEKMPRLVAELESQFVESAALEAAIRKNLKGLGYAL